MEVKLERLSDLPESESEFWEYANVELKKMETKPVCEHSFVQETSGKIKCNKCGMGLFIGVGDTINDGHLYHLDKLII